MCTRPVGCGCARRATINSTGLDSGDSTRTARSRQAIPTSFSMTTAAGRYLFSLGWIPLQSWLGLGTSASGAGCKRTLPGTHREVRELESAIQWTEYVSLRGQSFSRPTVTFVPCGVEPSAWCQRRVSAPRQRYSCQNCIGGQNGHGRRAVERRISPIPPFTQAVPLPLKVSAHLAAPNTAGGLSRHQARQSPAGDQRRARGGLSPLCSRLDG